MRRIASAWISKLKHVNQSVEEARLRNDFMYYLNLNCEKGQLLPPFDQMPPNNLVLDPTFLMAQKTGDPSQAQQDMNTSENRRRPEIFERSPDGGAFLVSQPVPRCGAFCYLAVVSRPPK